MDTQMALTFSHENVKDTSGFVREMTPEEKEFYLKHGRTSNSMIQPQVWDGDDGLTVQTGGYVTLCFLSMVLGYNEITDKNWTEVYGRFHQWKAVTGSTYFFGGIDKETKKEIDIDGDVFLNAEWFKKAIGFKCNASVLTAAAFQKKCKEYRA